MLALCLVAAFAVGALAASSSSAALPEWGKCVKLPATIKGVEKTTGKYADSNCTEKLEKATGGFELLKGTAELPSTEFENHMTSSEASLETAVGVAVKCTGETAKGFLSGTKEVSNVEVTFTGCLANLLEFACENVFKGSLGEGNFGYVEGSIVTRSLKGKLAYISGAGTTTPVVGLVLEPTLKNNLFAFFGCGEKNNPPVIWSNVGRKPTGANGGDKIVSPITPLNKMGTETVQLYKSAVHENPETKEIEDRGIQAPDEINGKPANLETQLLTGLGEIEWSKSSQEETAVTKLVSGEELEIRA